MPSDHDHMLRALDLARAAAAMGEVPVGAVITRDDQILAEAHNRRECDKSPFAHAEFLAIQQACKAINDWRLERCTLYITLEPCPMCAGLIVNARIPRVVFAAPDPKAGAAGTLMNLLEDPRLNHRCEVIRGLLSAESAELLTSFFRTLRAASGAPSPREGVGGG
ncbi:MAG: tRNA adenosine(34) deaminase TadA [Planctomycetes bacterium]|nr:tRNA adenosine(34) deaminase TadA [Planctomycetota bacterium]